MLRIVYQDDHLIAIDKPAGLLVHRSEIDRHETRFALQLLRDQIGRRVYPVHRLDKPTSGILLFALDTHTARLLTDAFTGQQVCKTYFAIVRGYTESAGVIDYPLREQLDRLGDPGRSADKPAQPAVTAYQRLATVELPIAVGRYTSSRYSLLSMAPRSGRKHQLRRHMKHIFHPIIGDTTHGDGRHNRMFRDHFNCRRLMLAAVRMQFSHPYSDAPLDLRTPPDAVWQQLAAQLGWKNALSSL